RESTGSATLTWLMRRLLGRCSQFLGTAFRGLFAPHVGPGPNCSPVRIPGSFIPKTVGFSSDHVHRPAQPQAWTAGKCNPPRHELGGTSTLKPSGRNQSACRASQRQALSLCINLELSNG